MDKLAQDFETKGLLNDYTKVNIPAAKKKVGVNEADVKPDVKTDNMEYNKQKKSLDFDNKVKGVLRGIAEEKARDPKNNNVEIITDPDIIEACKKEKVRTCRECGNVNCYIKFDLTRKAGKPPPFMGECKGRKTNFGDISKYAIQFKMGKKDQKQIQHQHPPNLPKISITRETALKSLMMVWITTITIAQSLIKSQSMDSALARWA